MNIKQIIRWAFPLFVIIWFPCAFFHEVLHYQAHNDSFTIAYGLPCAVVCLICLFRALKRKEICFTVVYGLAVVSCAFFCYWINRIPFCPICEPISKSDLGFMLEPFADSFFGP